MRFFSKAALAALLALGGATMARAQTTVNPLLPVQGTREIAFSGLLSFEPSDQYSFAVKYGPFLSTALQIAASVSYADGGTDKTATYGLEANYHFPSASQSLPYVGAFLGGRNIDRGSGEKDDNSGAYGLQAGVKYFVNSSVAAFGELQYRDTDTDGVKSTTQVLFGLSFFLR